MNPWRWWVPPTGPISPAQAMPATAVVPSLSTRRPASWPGEPNRWLPLPLHVKASAPAARRSVRRSSRSAVAASASLTWNCTVVPMVTAGQCPGGAVDTHDRPYKEVAGTEDLYVLIDDDPEMEAVSDPGGGRFIGGR